MEFKRFGLKAILLPILALIIPVAVFAAPPPKLVAFPVDPYVIDSGGKATGLAVDLMVKLTQLAGLSGDIELLPVARATVTLDGGNVVTVALGRSPEREPKYIWVAEVFSDSMSFVTPTGKPTINSYEEAKTVGTILANGKSAPEAVLRANGITDLDTSGASDNAHYTKLLAGRGVAWYGSTAVQKFIIRRNKAESKLVIGKAVQPTLWYIAASKDVDPEYIKKLQAAYKTLKGNGEYDKIFAVIK
jgi:ABC-type amino acid transport substrate-binding protein